MHGPAILARTLSARRKEDVHGNTWQYHSRSDHHSKVACWGIVLDLLDHSPILRRHVAEGYLHFGINHCMRDFRQDRKKDLDLVLCTAASGDAGDGPTLATMADHLGVALSAEERSRLDALPPLRRAPVGSVLVALEAKACMTEHKKAQPRLYDELNSSHLTVHGASGEAIAAGLVMINAAEAYLSPGRNEHIGKIGPTWNYHDQPRAAESTVAKVRQLPRRSGPGDMGYDALAIIVVDCRNDGSPFRVLSTPPAPAKGDIYEYAAMIERLSHVYATRFRDLA